MSHSCNVGAHEEELEPEYDYAAIEQDTVHNIKENLSCSHIDQSTDNRQNPILPVINMNQNMAYVIYKPWLGGVYAEYTTRGRGQRKFAAEINPERSEGFIEAANFR